MDRARCAVAMYHFVRNMHETPYPGIKGRLVDEFIGQVRYLCQYHEPLRTQDLLRFFDGEGDLPENGFYLTFDDGIKEHYEIVLPVLKGYGLEAAFSPMTEPLVHRRVPSMEKLRFMNNNLDFDMVYEEFFSTLERLFPNVDAGQWRFDEAKAAEARQYARFDEPKLAHFKRATTLEIPMEIRDAVLDNMFPRYFGLDEDFIQELYMTWDQIIELHAAGMTIGGHTVTHPWLPRLSADGQSKEINTCLDVLEEKLGTKLKVFAYTYGGYNEDTLEILRRRGCRLAFTTTVGVSCYRDKPLEVNRLDTNDLPLSPQAEPNRWSREVGTKRT